MKPKGKLFIIGGAEHKSGGDYLDMENKNIKFKKYEILNDLLTFSKDQPVEVITTSSVIPEKVKASYQKAFRNLNHPNPGFISIRDKREARNKSYQARIEEAGSVFFTGGDQFRLATILGGTTILDIIKRRYREDSNFLLAGTSAGAMAMCETMIVGGGQEEALLQERLKLSPGLGIIHNCIVDTHFIKRGRFGRLAHAVLLNSDLLGIGLGEDTALFIKNGSEAECRGSGTVIIIDGKKIKQTNIADAKRGEPIYVENLKVDILVKGCFFSLKRSQFLTNEKKYG